jgi:hypothetical protein
MAIRYLTIPGKAVAAFREGHNTNPEGERGTITWSEWLNRHYAHRQT